MDLSHALEEALLDECSYGAEADQEVETPLTKCAGSEVDERRIACIHEKLSVDAMLRKWVGEFGMAQLIHFVQGMIDAACLIQAIGSGWVAKAAPLYPNGGSYAKTATKPALWTPCSSLEPSAENGIFGNLSDSSLGRKGALRLACLISGLAGLATAFSPNYWIYLILRFITGLACGGIGLSAFVLSTEPIGPSKRGVVGMSTFYFYSTGIMVLCPLAYVSRNSWRHLYIFTSIPTLAYSVFILPFISESPRWYIVQGRTEDAMKTLRGIASKNGRSIPSGIELASELGDGDDGTPNTCQKASASLIDIFRYAETRTRMIIMAILWFACAVVYYGISLNVVNIGVSVYLSVFLNAIAEMPALAITALLLGKLGRKVMVAGSTLLSGLCCLIATFLITSPSSSSSSNNILVTALVQSNPSTNYSENAKKVGRMICGVMGIFGMAATYNLTFLYTVELFPTAVRNAALGLASQASQLGAVVAPLVVVLGRINPSFSFAVFAVSGITGGLLSLKLPETLNKPLWDTMEGLKSEEQNEEHDHQTLR